MAGILYGALTDDGYGVGTPFKSSRIGKDIGYKAFKVLRDVERQTERTGSARQTVKDAMSPHNTREEFRRLLKTENIDAIFRINPIGRIYGVTFIDHNAGIVANGSVQGKEFSANVFNDLYPAPKEGCQVAEQRYSERKLDPQSHTTNPLTEAADTLLDLADTKAYEEQQRIIQRRKNENRINNILFIV